MRNRFAFVCAAVTGAVLLTGGTTASAQTASPPARAASAVSLSAADGAPDWTPSNAPAGAQACGVRPTTNGYGGATVTTSIYLRTGPSSACDDIYPKLLVGQRLGGWCYYKNPAKNLWYYVSTGGGAPYGWIYGGNITEEETIKTPCNV
ncbi:hypothetical protein [Streptomyces sp. PsTaAH-124]|uniref:hypothetical protein n=1 Tax=Streptomyces sp. PsTaAH-124 TaxID=1157638 RepID=UPI00036111E6|nr:hypothetical protein [Streptomyces sp. PsTaAH-124]